LWGAALAVGQVATAEPPPPPHVLLVSVDTLRADRLGSYGYPRPISPHIDALLAEGVRFTQARTVEPLTSPALTSMLTGLEPHEHAATRNGLRMRADLLSFPKIFKRRGYETAALVGNWTLRDELTGLGEHFESYVEVLDKQRWFGLFKGEATAEDLSDRALDWVSGRAEPQRPFLLWVHYVEPHAPYVLQAEVVSQVGSGDTADKSYRYDSEVAFVDRHIGRLVAGVREATAGEELVIVFVSDHGESLGEHDYWGHGRHLFEPTLHIPMGVIWPGHIAPSTLTAPALITDLAPTLLSLAGLPTPDFYSGFDWTPVLAGQAPEPKERVTYYQAHKGAVQRRDPPQRVRQQGLLELGRLAGSQKEILRIPNSRRWIFDLATDPAELRSLAPPGTQSSDEIRAWARRVQEGLVRSDELPPPALDDADLDELRDLGYID
jgi:arylsulfatase A-like enzyme